jgi:hypothetical protein
MGWQALTLQFIKGTRAGTDPSFHEKQCFKCVVDASWVLGLTGSVALCAIFYRSPLPLLPA